jgi:hypothetical protein
VGAARALRATVAVAASHLLGGAVRTSRGRQLVQLQLVLVLDKPDLERLTLRIEFADPVEVAVAGKAVGVPA